MRSKIPTCFIILVVLLTACQQTLPLRTQADVQTPTYPSSIGHTTQELTVQDNEQISKPDPDSTPAGLNPITRPTSVDELVSRLQGLELNNFFQISFRAILARSPEGLLTDGLEDAFGVDEPALDDISQAYQLETHQMMAAILEILETYDRASLSPADQLSYDVYQWYLQDRLAAWDFRLYNYPATYFPITSIHEDLLLFMTDIHPIHDLQDGHDYIKRLGQINHKIEQLIENLENSQQASITPPRFAIQWAVYGSLGEFVATEPRTTCLYTTLQEKLDPLSNVTPQEKQALLDEAEQTIREQVIPAYKALQAYLDSMQTYNGEDSGVWRLPQGEAYYDYQLRHFTTMNISTAEIHQLGLDELARIQANMRSVFSQLGYPADETLVQAYNRVARDGGLVAGNQVLTTYESLIAEAQIRLDTAFDLHPRAEVIVVPDPYGDFYIPASLDGARPGAFYAGVGDNTKDYYAMPTLAYHETVPGHHLQIALAQEMVGLPAFRQGVTFTAYTEGWALYAEQLAWELGWYQDDPYGYLGLLQSQAFRAARLVVDTGLHAQGWTFSQAQDFFTQNTGFEVGDNVNPQHQIARYLVWPGQSVSYYIGYLKIMELRQQAMEELEEKFDLKEFHRVVLGNGSLPLELLERVVQDYIRAKITS